MDLRVALLGVYKLLHCLDIQVEVNLLLQTAVKIAEILYSSDEKRTPKTILQLYNCTWMHYELCQHLPIPRNTLEKQSSVSTFMLY